MLSTLHGTSPASSTPAANLHATGAPAASEVARPETTRAPLRLAVSDADASFDVPEDESDMDALDQREGVRTVPADGTVSLRTMSSDAATSHHAPTLNVVDGPADREADGAEARHAKSPRRSPAAPVRTTEGGLRRIQQTVDHVSSASSSTANQAVTTELHSAPALGGMPPNDGGDDDDAGGNECLVELNRAPDEHVDDIGSFELRLPRKPVANTRIITTPLMIETVNRTLNVHYESPIVVWTGPSRNGKTETAKWLVRKLDERANRDPAAFRAKHFQFGGTSAVGAAGRKATLRSVHTATIGRIKEGEYRELQIENLARKCAVGLHALNVELLLVDEAGLLGVDGLRALVLLRDVATDCGWTLNIVLIGMDDLPTDLKSLPQIERRVHEWCYFKPYDREEMERLVQGLMPEYPEFTCSTPDGLAMIKFLLEKSSGLPGLLAPLLAKVRATCSLMGEGPSLPVLHASYMNTERDKGHAERASNARAARAGALELNIGRKDGA